MQIGLCGLCWNRYRWGVKSKRCLLAAGRRGFDKKLDGWLWLGALCLWLLPGARGEVTRAQLDLWLDSNVHDWRWHFGEVAGAERPGFDDSQWERVDLGFKWWPHDSTGWFRTRITEFLTEAGPSA